MASGEAASTSVAPSTASEAVEMLYTFAPSIVWLDEKWSFLIRLSSVLASLVTQATRKLARAPVGDGLAIPITAGFPNSGRMSVL